jgi:hypothetical protein
MHGAASESSTIHLLGSAVRVQQDFDGASLCTRRLLNV